MDAVAPDYGDLDEFHPGGWMVRGKHFATKREAAAYDAEMRAADAAAKIRPASFVYFVRGIRGLIKIGVAVDPWRRVGELQTGSDVRLSLLAVMPGDKATERGLHERFATDRVRGEWFSTSHALRAVIAEAKRGKHDRWRWIKP